MIKLANEQIIRDDEFAAMLPYVANDGKRVGSFAQLLNLLRSGSFTGEQFARIDEMIAAYGDNVDSSFWIVDVGTNYEAHANRLMESDQWFVLFVNALEQYEYRNRDNDSRGVHDSIYGTIVKMVYERVMANIADIVNDNQLIMYLERWLAIDCFRRELKLAMISNGIARDYCYKITEYGWYGKDFDEHYTECLSNFYAELDDCAKLGVVL